MENAAKILRKWKVNGKRIEVRAAPGRRVLDILREDLGLTGAKEGCGEGECGACTVLLDGAPVVACLLTAGQLVDGSELTTIEGVMRTRLGRVLQRAYMDAGAVQCGFCIPGMILSSYALLKRDPSPSEGEIRVVLAGNLCRCTGYVKIVEAVQLASERWRERREAQSGRTAK
jgi:carbon-monoxide dehydrogenase small subunit